MANYTGIPEMLETFMAESGSSGCWITVGQLRQRFGFPRGRCTGVSRFLRRLHEGTYRNFPYVVQSIERDPSCGSPEIGVLRYRVRRRGNIPDFSETACRREECRAAE
ncbi:MAG TPA: hypothetical protein P5217_07310 [Methanoregulaceae archaeon]|nr:hypothetical protein [Methanoregulaceae archaeon]HPD76252.1 hypothetical protein [Methanoregulaceae archaeon]HRY76075.1 hypothetical protein [Methanoregulaceae archaeon]